MFRNAFYLVVIIWATFVCANAADTVVDCAIANKFFECPKDKATIFSVGGINISCPGGNICNLNFKTLDATTCLPCLPPTTVCTGYPVITCLSDGKFKMQDITFDCPKDFKCNDGYKNGCQPCYQEICADDAWTCGPAADDVTTKQYKGKCLNGGKCKLVKTGPCEEPCTLNGDSGSTTFTPTDRDLTTDPTLVTTPKETSNPTIITSTTVGRSTTTCNDQPFKIPNCNDGHGTIWPCRPGPCNKAYYYRCKPYSPVWFDYEIKHCKNLKLDPLCIGKVC